MDQRLVLQAIDDLSPVCAWPRYVQEFLKRQHTLACIVDTMHDSGKSAEEAVLVLLAAMRYLDIRGADPRSMTSLLEESPPASNLDLFLVRHHHEIMHLAVHNHVQANVAARALPVMDMLSTIDTQRPLAMIELGCSAGIIGRVLRSADYCMAHFERYFSRWQQKPQTWRGLASYVGFDLKIPDTDWMLACLASPQERERAALLLADLPSQPELYTLRRGSAFSFHNLCGPLDPSFQYVVLTSFMLYQLTEADQHRLREIIEEFCRSSGSHWINLEVERGQDGNLAFVAYLDSIKTLELHDDYCSEWTMFHEGKLYAHTLV